MSGMARAVEKLGLRACLTESIMDTGEGLPTSWAMRTTDDCIQVEDYTGFLVDIVEFITMLFFDMLMCAYITALMSEQPGLLS